jgi:hypothetical protein
MEGQDVHPRQQGRTLQTRRRRKALKQIVLRICPIPRAGNGVAGLSGPHTSARGAHTASCDVSNRSKHRFIGDRASDPPLEGCQPLRKRAEHIDREPGHVSPGSRRLAVKRGSACDDSARRFVRDAVRRRMAACGWRTVTGNRVQDRQFAPSGRRKRPDTTESKTQPRKSGYRRAPRGAQRVPRDSVVPRQGMVRHHPVPYRRRHFGGDSGK